MEGYRFNIRKTWQQSFGLLYFDEKDLKNQKKAKRTFDEDEFWINTPILNKVDVGWHGDIGKSKLIGMIVKCLDWDHPLEKKKLNTFKEAIDWVEKAIQKLEKIEDKMSQKEKQAQIRKVKKILEEI